MITLMMIHRNGVCIANTKWYTGCYGRKMCVVYSKNSRVNNCMTALSSFRGLLLLEILCRELSCTAFPPPCFFLDLLVTSFSIPFYSQSSLFSFLFSFFFFLFCTDSWLCYMMKISKSELRTNVLLWSPTTEIANRRVKSFLSTWGSEKQVGIGQEVHFKQHIGQKSG